MKKFLLAVVAVAAFGAPQAATNLGADTAGLGVRSTVATAGFTANGTGSNKLVPAASTTDSAIGAEPSTYAMMFLGLGLIGLSLRSRRNSR
jgi:PEP-CTERM motif